MKVCLGQINTTPGDFAGNLEKVRVGIEAASKAQADLVVFPELTLPGYLSQDLIYNPDFIERNLQALQEVVEM
ncbi:MAG: NAD+ synthase, partial [Gammaproteobacteria bacterium]|nr:NAD+ synthase [Gammaproteobacteria bacterium]